MADTSETYELPKHPIQVVSRRTGLSKDVIRIWERRYGVIEPGRSETGRRMYADAHIDRLLLLKEATDNGRRISDVAALTPTELDELLASDRSARLERPTAPAIAIGSGETSHAALCMRAVRALDPVQLESRLASASVALPVPGLLDEVIAPLLVEIGRLWHAGKLRVGQEHMASSVIRGFLDNLRRTANMGADGPTVLVTTPSGQNHELGALMAAVAAASAGWQSLYLNPNTPAPDIVAMAQQAGARAVALSLIFPVDDARIGAELRFLRDQLASDTAIIVGGSAAPAYGALLDEIGAVRLSRYSDIGGTLERIRGRELRTGT